MFPSNPGKAPSAEELLKRNEDLAKVHQPIPFFEEMPAGSPKPRTFIFCCFDTRVDPAAFLGLKYAEALIVRNAGGAVGPNLESLIALDYYLGTLEDVLVIQHTDCGALHFVESDIHNHMKDLHLGSDEQIDGLKFELHDTLEQRVRENVKLIKTSPFIRKELKDRTKGLIYDLKTGKLTEIQD
ncbi:hypothetical protein VMCG_03778 [Cytospora schulzeri]|uniref:Carbonic anhydrase n=1 Tax=Cytospora schulzeri TaxID=448051 RepID=A0A423WUR9_9PEZI|nr:hypothetical protein VMCG_03778 [Valsa malicola]